MNGIGFRTTAYDVVGYIIPGLCLCFSVIGFLRWLDIYTFDALIKYQMNVYCFTVLLLISYVCGHFVNSLSSCVLEKHILKEKYFTAKNWTSRVSDGSLKKIELMLGSVPQDEDLIKLVAEVDKTMPDVAFTALRFQAFYGMSRSLSLLSMTWTIIVFGVWICRNQAGILQMILDEIVILILGGGVTMIWVNQYLRFVRYHSDYVVGAVLNFKRQ